MQPFNRRHLLAAAALMATAPALQAQSTPTLRLLVGYTAGGPVDAAARQFAPALATQA